MKIYYKGNRLTEILILSFAVIIAIVFIIFFKKIFWMVIPYILLEIIVLYFLLNFTYIIESKFIKIKYGFITWRQISVNSIHKLIIQDKIKGEPESSPHRIKIFYGKNKILFVSPTETVSFVENIERLRPDIEII